MNMRTRENAYFKLRADGSSLILNNKGYYSYPLLRKEDAAHLRYFLVFGVSFQRSNKITQIYRPKSLIVTNVHLTAVVAFQDYRVFHDPFKSTNWDDPIGDFPHADAAGLSYADFRQLEGDLICQYHEVAKNFQAASVMNDFAILFRKLTPPYILPFIKSVAPEFCDWLRRPA